MASMAFDWEAFKGGLTGSSDWADSDDLARMSIETFRTEGGGLRRDSSSGSLRLTGSGIEGHSGSIDGIAETLRNLQRLVLATGLASTGHTSLRGQPPADVVAKTRLSLSGSPLPGSLVLQMVPAMPPAEEIVPDGQAGLFGDTEDQLVDLAVKDALGLLDGGRQLGPDVDGSAFLSDLTQRGPRVASTLRDFTTTLVKFGFEPDIAWAQPRRPRLRTRLSTAELAYIGQIISSRELELEPTTIRGVLRTVSDIAAWQLEMDGGEIVKIDARAIPKAQTATLGTGAIISINVNVTEESGPADEARQKYAATSFEVLGREENNS